MSEQLQHGAAEHLSRAEHHSERLVEGITYLTDCWRGSGRGIICFHDNWISSWLGEQMLSDEIGNLMKWKIILINIKATV